MLIGNKAFWIGALGSAVFLAVFAMLFVDLDTIEMMEERPLQNGKSLVGHLRSATYSPHFKKVVGIAMIKKEYWDKKTTFVLEINGKKSKGSICDLPLV